MKYRYGFVSNSSSSSFLIVASMQDWLKIYGSCSEYQQRLLEEFFENHEIDGKKVKIMCEVIGSDHPETLDQIPVLPDYELAVSDSPWQLFDKRHQALLAAISKFDNSPGIVIKELCM